MENFTRQNLEDMINSLPKRKKYLLCVNSEEVREKILTEFPSLNVVVTSTIYPKVQIYLVELKDKLLTFK